MLEPVTAGGAVGFDMAHDGQPDNCRHAAAADEQAAAVWWEAHHFFEPIEHPVLQVGARLVAAGGAGVHAGSQQLADDAHWRARRVDPGEKAGVVVAQRVRVDVFRYKLEKFVRAGTFLWQWLLH